MLRNFGLLAACLVFSVQAFAADNKASQKEALDNFTAKAEEFRANPAINEMLPDLAKLDKCLTEAGIYLKDDDKEKPLERNLKLAQVQTRYIAARLDEISARDLAAAAEKAASEHEADAKKLENEAKTLEKKTGGK